MKDIEQTLLIRIDAYSYAAILGELETKEIQAKAFIDIREPTNLLQQDYLNLFSIGLCPVWPGSRCGQAETKWHVPSLMEARSLLSQTRPFLNCAS
jgi:hypothetical protein